MLKTLKILGVKITSESKEKILEYIFSRLKNPQKKTFIITPNPEMLVYASRHLDYQDKLNSAEVALPDGIGLFFASGFKGKQLRERITGIDFMEDICKKAWESPVSMGFLGGKQGVAERAADCLKRKYPWINIVFTGSEWPSSKKIKITELRTPASETIDILFVAYGVPKQEEWIVDNLEKLPVKAAMGVGGSFDYLSGAVSRAPYLVRFFGFEWLFRLIKQPWRWKRQLALLEFIYLVFTL